MRLTSHFADSCLNIFAMFHHPLNNSKYTALEEPVNLDFCRRSEEKQAATTQRENDYKLKTTFSFHSALAVAKFNVNGYLSKQGADFNHQPSSRDSTGCHVYRHVGEHTQLKLMVIFHTYFSIKPKHTQNISIHNKPQILQIHQKSYPSLNTSKI